MLCLPFLWPRGKERGCANVNEHVNVNVNVNVDVDVNVDAIVFQSEVQVLMAPVSPRTRRGSSGSRRPSLDHRSTGDRQPAQRDGAGVAPRCHYRHCKGERTLTLTVTLNFELELSLFQWTDGRWVQ